MSTYIIIAILAVVIVFALKGAIKHMKGEGGCCGGLSGDVIKAERKTLNDPIVAEKELAISGMTCSNCAARVQNALNTLDGVAAVVSLKRKSAHVSMTRPVTDAELRAVVARAGYDVVSIS